MKAEWLANVDGQEYGPYTWNQMLQMAAEGRVPADLPVRRAHDKRWFKASQVPGLVTPAPPTPAARDAVASSSARPASGVKKGDSHLKRAKPLVAAAASHPVAPPPTPPPVSEPPAASIASEPPGGWPLIVTDGARKTPLAERADEGSLPKRRKSNAILVGVLAAVSAVILFLGGTVVWIVWLKKTGSVPQDQVAVAAVSKTSTTEKQESSAAQEAAVNGVALNSEKEEKGAGDGPTKGELAAQAKTVRSISKWNSLAVSPGATISNANVRVTRVWRTDAAGDKKSDSGRNYVCVEVAIRNQSRSPLKYRGWNSFGEHGAILADEGMKVLPLVPVAKTPDLSRLTGGSVPGNGSVTEVLVFEAPAGEDEVLHLVLPYAVFYSNVKPPYRAIELTPDVMGVDLAASAPTSDRANRTEETLRDAIAGPTPAGAAPPATATEPAKPGASGEAKSAAKGKDGKPPSLKEMIDKDPGTPARPDDPPADKDAKTKDKPAKGETKDPPPKKTESPKKPENPFEPKPDANPLDPLSVVPKGENQADEP